MKRTWKKIMQIANVNKNLQLFQQRSNMKNILLITEQKFLRTLRKFLKILRSPSLFTKTFQDKVFTSHEKVHENAIIQNEKPQRVEK